MAVSAENDLRKVEWRSNLSVGVPSIDDEHRLLIGVLNQLIEARDTPTEYTIADRVLRDLFAYSDYHFEHEEELMATYDYPEMDSHLAQHTHFIGQLRRLDLGLSTGNAKVDDLARFVMTWFVAHIMVADMQLGSFLSERLCPERSPFEFEDYRLAI
ncbi:MAG: bacteriohemerythrin [Rhodospirillaceae bacterium]